MKLCALLVNLDFLIWLAKGVTARRAVSAKLSQLSIADHCELLVLLIKVILKFPIVFYQGLISLHQSVLVHFKHVLVQFNVIGHLCDFAEMSFKPFL